jgi:3-dehydroquinate dehydratase / shikimate dehydrogenase
MRSAKDCRLCVVVRETTTERAVAALAQAASLGDMVEIRADYIREPDIRALLRNKPCPVLFTLRPRHEGGEYAGAEIDRLDSIIQAARAGADYVDVEFSSFWQAILEKVPKEKVILSHHNFSETPSALEGLVDSMAAAGAGVLKIACTAQRLGDNLVIRRALLHAQANGLNLCALAMGRPGIPSRVLGPAWGSWMALARLPGEPGTADGQLSADEMIHVFRSREIGPETALYGVVGKPLGHSLSPLIHNAAFAARKQDSVMLPLEAGSMDDFLEFCAAVSITGASVTLPYKQQACAISRSLSVEADSTGAVNTLVSRPSGWHGENSDVDGFIRPLMRRTHLAHKRAVVLGAGGAARSVVYALRAHDAEVCVVARDLQKAAGLADAFGARHAAWDQFRSLRWDILVNATPVGMYPEIDQSPVSSECLTGEWVCDLVYNPASTRLLKEAARQGCRVIPGTEMFLGQAVKQQTLWGGSPPPEEAMRGALDAALKTTNR